MSLLKSENLYSGKVITFNREWVELPDGQQCELEIIHHPGGAAIVALDEQGRVCLLRQYRHAAKGWIWELPAGKIDHQEAPDVTARRELQEEVGCSADHWQSLGTMLSSPGFFTEVLYLYLAQGLEMGEQQLEPGELLEVHWVDFATVIQRVYQGEINDAKSCLGLLRAANVINSG